MVNKTMYKNIQKLKLKGNSKAFVSRKLDLTRKTVKKYWDMSETDYQEYLFDLMFRSKEFDPFKDEIFEVYAANEYKKLQASSIFDYLEEKYGLLPATEKSMRNYINYLVESGQLELKNNVRIYQKVPELPMGKQLQLDFGEYKMKSGLKLYMFASVLSSSRYKYIAFQDKPFTTEHLITHLLNCFDYIGGMPEELVIDQDSVMVVSENHGDIIYTKDFSAFKDEMGLKIYTCRKADPETKGKIENVIKFVKRNFLSIRNFTLLEEARNSLARWLVRRANGKISQATRRIPAIAFEDEKNHLRPLKNSIFRRHLLIAREDRSVSDKSYISCNGSTYSVPVKYRNKSVDIYPATKNLFVYDQNTGEEIVCHTYSLIPGGKMTIYEHFRESSKKLIDLKQEVLDLFESPLWIEFAEINFKIFPRYNRDQCILAKKFFSKDIKEELLNKSLDHCLENKTYSYKDLSDAYNYFKEEPKAEKGSNLSPAVTLNISHKIPTPDVAKRAVDVYTDLVKGGKELCHERI